MKERSGSLVCSYQRSSEKLLMTYRVIFIKLFVLLHFHLREKLKFWYSEMYILCFIFVFALYLGLFIECYTQVSRLI
jgi:hypothetical protein